MPLYYGQPQVFDDRVLHIADSRVLSAIKDTLLPPSVFVPGAEPSAYIDHGAIVAGRVEINLEITKESIDLGRVPTPARFYLSAQRCSIRFNAQEYQPEMISLAAGGLGVPTDLGNMRQVYMGGELGAERRVVVVDSFDQSPTTDPSEPWWQYWFTNPNGQGGGTFNRGEEKAAFVIPMEFEFLRFVVDNTNRLIEFRAVET